MTTADYAPSVLQKAATSLPRVLTLDGDQIVSVMVEHGLGLRPSPNNAERLDIDPDYFLAFEAMKGLLSHHVAEARQQYSIGSSPSSPGELTDEQTIDLKPEEDLISLNALGYALRVDPARIRRWVENETLRPDNSQLVGERASYYFRKEYYIRQAEAGKPLEHGASLLADPTRASESAIKRLIITNPLERFLIKNFMAYFPVEGVLQIAPQLWQELRHYEVIDVLKSIDEQISYYIDRHTKKSGRTRFY